ncbi:ABC transporter ATP-binding protein [cf. Phormidesmis sp. LEGE 11477]|uniref:ABC transporter ATP-binding protein n=1 Tax=cf. Phormidesmis sp. LEGE 11477 TaxID=1828680 RepID=UPI001881611A|nr:ATP-binding cassette domain-containing protein [cf. Phormidesmis sp. LEGE 11477]MBE9061371.1 ATP-binding cassette domain-containing protein [cf. Phormidesmis sp. LEGE 11477]
MVSKLGVDIEVTGLTKYLGEKVLYENFDLKIARGKITCIFGPNGCGKSTLLNMMAGLLTPDAGQMRFGTEVRSSGRTKTIQKKGQKSSTNNSRNESPVKIGYVFQNYRDALFPWLRAAENIEYPLLSAGLSRLQRKARVETLIHQFDVGFDLSRYPYELSGGQQQLVSIMRALSTQPNILFLDEPFSALDYEATLAIRDKLQEVFTATGVTIVMISHDLEEAVYLADHILLLTKRPTRLAERVVFEAQRPRTLKTLSEPAFVSTKAHSLEVFRREAS